MKYIAVRMRDRDGYTQQLEKLTGEGCQVISAGMAENRTICGFEWWAILQRDEASTQEVERKESAARLEALKEIRDECAARDDCAGCKYYNGHICALGDWPEHWTI